MGWSHRLVSGKREARLRFSAAETSMPSPAPANETERLAALHALDIVDSAPETPYNEITELAAQICGCPVAYISFIDDDRRWLKARYGLPAGMGWDSAIPALAEVERPPSRLSLIFGRFRHHGYCLHAPPHRPGRPGPGRQKQCRWI